MVVRERLSLHREVLVGGRLWTPTDRSLAHVGYDHFLGENILERITDFEVFQDSTESVKTMLDMA